MIVKVKISRRAMMFQLETWEKVFYFGFREELNLSLKKGLKGAPDICIIF